MGETLPAIDRSILIMFPFPFFSISRWVKAIEMYDRVGQVINDRLELEVCVHASTSFFPFSLD